jgi:Cu+-exporting ATPase
MHSHGEHITLKVEGMDCANCALGITKKLTKSGHNDVQVNFATGEASLQMAESCTLQDVIGDIEGLGYKVVQEEQKEQFRFGVTQKFWFTLIFTIPLFFGHMFFPHDSWIAQPLTQLLLCLPVILVGGWHFGKSALGSLKAGVPNMDVLIFIGSVSAFGYSVAGMLMYKGHEVHNYMFFETTATIITLVLLGNLLEHLSVKKTTSAISELSSLQPPKARRITVRHGEEYIEEIPSSQIGKGDLLLVNAGESIPADGEVTLGDGSTDESMITGESVPVEKTTGTPVTGGTVLLSGPLRMKVTRTGSETTLSHIISLVKKAQNEKPPVQQLADKISAIFVPVVLGISLLTFLIAYFGFHLAVRDALMNSIAVLVISCPCAMGLATPTAVMVGIGRAARAGILVRGGRTLEQLAAVQTVVFDKTGTLTTGKFSAIRVESFDGFSEAETKSLLLAIEQHSAHPLAKSIVSLLQAQAVLPATQLSSISEEKGIGMKATLADGSLLQVGSWRLLPDKNGWPVHDIYLLKNGQPLAGISLEDEIRPGMEKLIAFLRSKKIRTILLSGDRKEKCASVAASLGIDEVIAEQLPAQKSETIAALSAQSKTAMVGDGINDAPALARADIGISPGDASQVAMQSSQVLLLGHDGMEKLIQALLIGRHSLATIRQNLFWAFFYNVIAIPVAAFGLLNPMVAALSMAFSDVIVIGNSIRLRTKRLS